MPETPQSQPKSETFSLTAEQAQIVEQFTCPDGYIKKIEIVGRDKDGSPLVQTLCKPCASPQRLNGLSRLS